MRWLVERFGASLGASVAVASLLYSSASDLGVSWETRIAFAVAIIAPVIAAAVEYFMFDGGLSADTSRLLHELDKRGVNPEQRAEIVRKFLGDKLTPRERGDFVLGESVRNSVKTPR